MIIDAQQLATFAVFAEHLNFTRAGAALGLSQPAVHAQVQRLSAALDAVLYTRQGRRLTLTSAGRKTLAHARETAEHQSRFLLDLKGESEPQPVRIAAGEGVLLYVLGPALTRHVRAGHAAPQLQVLSAAAIREAVQTSAADIGVLPRAGLRPGIEAVRMLQVQQALVCTDDHPLAQHARVSLTDLSDEALILPPPGRPQRVAVESALADAGATCRVGVEVTGWPMTLHAVTLGLGLAIVNDYCQPPEGCVMRPIDGLPTVELFAVRRHGGNPSQSVLDLWQRLV